MTSVAIKVYGMDCAEEVAVLKGELSPLAGVENLNFDVLNGKMLVSYDEEKLGLETLIEAVKKTGMRAELYSESGTIEQDGTLWEKWGRTALTTLSGVLLAAGFAVHSTLVGLSEAITEGAAPIPAAARLLYLFALVAGAWFVIPKAWLSLKRFRPDMNLLMTIAVFGALIIGEWFEAATVAFLFAFSLALESWSVSRARKAVAALMELAPPTATIMNEDGTERIVDVKTVPVGARIVVRPGEKFPLDGKIISGTTSVNQAPITGESLPVHKAVGDEVYSGTINEDGAVEVQTTKGASESTLSNIAKLVTDAQSKRSPSEQWVEKFAKYYTPIILGVAVATMILPPLFDQQWERWFYEALVLLVIGCPCALVISTPVSIVAALASAAKQGILIKGGLYVETPSKLRAIAMDKTGTLTRGKLAVSELVPLSGHTEKELLEIACAIEKRSEHPIAKAIVAHAEAAGVLVKPVDSYQAVKGKGAEALLGGKKVWVGSHRYLEERGQETSEMHERILSMSKDGKTIVVVGEASHVCGLISLADELRPESREVVAKLKARGIQKVVMLTGDNLPTAQAIQKLTGVDEVRADMLPENKISAIEGLVEEYKFVAMVGDGVNDSPALARASIGIAMGAMGSDAALETADIALMRDNLHSLPWLIDHSKRAVQIIRQNIFASIGIKFVFVVLTFSGHASLWAAIAADMGVSFMVVANALRLLKTESLIVR